MTTYARLTTVDYQGTCRTLLYRILSEGPQFIMAVQVSLDGTRIGGYKRKDGTLVETVHAIDVTTVTKRVPLVMNNHYGQLEAEA